MRTRRRTTGHDEILFKSFKKSPSAGFVFLIWLDCSCHPNKNVKPYGITKSFVSWCGIVKTRKESVAPIEPFPSIFVSIKASVLLLIVRSQLFNTRVSKFNQLVQKLFVTLLGSLWRSYFIVIIVFCIVILSPAISEFLARSLAFVLDTLAI
jgi:hypothetical protein